MLQTFESQPTVSTLENQFSTWLANHGKRGHGHSQNSIDAYLSDVRGFSRWFEPHAGQSFSADLIISKDLHDYFTFSTEEERVSAATWNRRRISLALFCQFTLENGMAAYNVFQGVPVMEKQKCAPKSLNKSDYLKLLRRVEQAANTARSDHQRFLAIRNRAMISLMVYAGLRVGELCALRADDLLLSDRKGEVKIRDGKGNKSGDVPLGREARIALVDWLKVSSGEMVFGGITERQVQRVVAEIGGMAGIEIHPHMLRHTFVYNILQQTGNLVIAQQLARHSKIEQTARYAMPHQEDLERAVENI